VPSATVCFTDTNTADYTYAYCDCYSDGNTNSLADSHTDTEYAHANPYCYYYSQGYTTPAADAALTSESARLTGGVTL
jgi:hypothetical protein